MPPSIAIQRGAASRTSRRTASAAAAAVMPYSRMFTSPGALAPNRSTPIAIPRSPIQRSQPNVAAASIETRAVTRGRQHLFAVRLVLRGEDAPTTASTRRARRSPSSASSVARLERLLDLAARRDQDRVRLAPLGVGENVRAAQRAPRRPPASRGRARGASGASRRSRVGPWTFVIAKRQDSVASAASAGRKSVEVGHRAQRQRGARPADAWGRPPRDRWSRASTGRRPAARQRRQPHRWTHVIAEHEERRAERAHAAVVCHAVRDRAHPVLADAVVEVPALAGLAVERGFALDRVHRGLGEVRVATEKPGHRLRDRAQRVAGRVAGGVLVARLPGREVGVPARRELVRPREPPLLGERFVLASPILRCSSLHSVRASRPRADASMCSRTSAGT